MHNSEITHISGRKAQGIKEGGVNNNFEDGDNTNRLEESNGKENDS